MQSHRLPFFHACYIAQFAPSMSRAGFLGSGTLENCSRALLPTPTLTVRPIYPIPPTPTGLSPRDLIRRELASLHNLPIDDITIVSDVPARQSPYLDACGGSTAATADGYVVELSVPGATRVFYYVGPKGDFEYCKM